MRACHEVMGDARLYQQLLRFDEDLARQVRASGCPCGGRLHRSVYPRKPRGLSGEIEGFNMRFSFCCNRDKCRKRATPPSLRYLGRRVYLGAVVVLVSAMMHGLTGRRVARLQRIIGADRRTLERWRTWWREEFVEMPLWREARGFFLPPLAHSELPAGLLQRFAGTERLKLCLVLKLLLPLTTTSWLSMVSFDPQRLLTALRVTVQ